MLNTLCALRVIFCSSRYQWYKMILRDRAKWQTKVEDLRKEKQKAELAECTFRPSIQPFNPRSHIAVIIYLYY